MKVFKSVYNRGFQITFDNGVTISVQFGRENYCERRVMFSDVRADLNNAQTESNDAEVAIWREDGEWITRQAMKDVFSEHINDDVEGHLEAERIGRLIAWAMEA